jgi:hypothetical protein
VGVRTFEVTVRRRLVAKGEESGVSANEAVVAVRRLRSPDQRGQGRADTPETGQVTADRLAEMEQCAVSIRSWNPLVIPGLLQTLPYAAAAIRTALPALPVEEVQRRAYQRGRRIRAFVERWTSHRGLGHAWFIIGQSAIRQPLINPRAHAGQLLQVMEMSKLPQVLVQVLPDEVPTPGRSGQFTVYNLEKKTPAPTPGAQLPGTRVGYIETPVGAWYTTRTDDVARLYSGFSDMIGAAWSRDRSREYIKEEMKCWGTTVERLS